MSSGHRKYLKQKYFDALRLKTTELLDGLKEELPKKEFTDAFVACSQIHEQSVQNIFREPAGKVEMILIESSVPLAKPCLYTTRWTIWWTIPDMQKIANLENGVDFALKYGLPLR